MTEIIGVRFKSVGKIYYFAPEGEVLHEGSRVIVETARGIECGSVAIPNRMVEDEKIVGTLKPILRVATPDDLMIVEQNAIKEKKAVPIFLDKVKKHDLHMKLVDIEYTFDNSKILFYFTADGRVDFRELVKDLASVFRARIELRQIGVRDEAKNLGGLGICGRPFCCSSFMGEFVPVSIKMAKEQGLSLNPTKISGTCSRLMCCLKYEQDSYEELLAITPKVGALVETAEGKGVVTECNLLTGSLKVRLDAKRDAAPISVKREDVRLIRDAQIRVGRDEMYQLRGLEDHEPTPRGKK